MEMAWEEKKIPETGKGAKITRGALQIASGRIESSKM